MNWKKRLAYNTGTVDQELLLRNEYLATENRILKAQIKGYDRITGAVKNLGHTICAQMVGNILARHGLEPVPERNKKTTWKEFIQFQAIFKSAGLTLFPLPPMSPTLNAIAERFVRSIKEECVERLILLGEGSLRKAIEEYVEHYHGERNHQGKGNVILFPSEEDRIGAPEGEIQRRERLGGLLKYYRRAG
jgi:hypothetical protein